VEKSITPSAPPTGEQRSHLVDEGQSKRPEIVET